MLTLIVYCYIVFVSLDTDRGITVCKRVHCGSDVKRGGLIINYGISRH